jgi:hypothetical protein
LIVVSGQKLPLRGGFFKPLARPELAKSHKVLYIYIVNGPNPGGS